MSGMQKRENWLFGFAAIGAVAALVEILEHLKITQITPSDWGRFLTPPIQSLSPLVWGTILFALSLGLSLYGLYLSNRRRASSSSVATLEYQTWHGGSTRNLPIHWPGETANPTWVCIKNTKAAPPQVAKYVTARLEFMNSAQTNLLIVPEAVWWEIRNTPGGNTHSGWRHGVDIEGGDEQSLFYS